MFTRIGSGWALAKQSLAVLKADKELLLFPLISGISLVVVSASFLVPLFVSDPFRQYLQTETSSRDILVCAMLFLFYFINYFVIMFFNAGLIGCAMIRFRGGNPTLGDGFRTAMERLLHIFCWALVSATVGMLLKVIESSSEKVGQIVTALLGMTWSVTTYFVLPVLVVEKIGPVTAFKRSTSILKNTWGEALSANIGIAIIVFFMGLFALLPAGLGIIIGTSASVLTGIVVSVVCLILVSLISSAVRTIITVALYDFAGNSHIPEQFDQRVLEQAFGPKSR